MRRKESVGIEIPQLLKEAMKLHKKIFGISSHINSKDKDSLIQEILDLREFQRFKDSALDEQN